VRACLARGRACDGSRCLLSLSTGMARCPAADVNRRVKVTPRSASKGDPSERVVPVVHRRDPPPERSASARSVAEGVGGPGGGVFSARITSSIAKLDDEHLLDLHDIFRSDAGSPLDDMASAEMRKRNLQPETNG
jgi:hypothetical protein